MENVINKNASISYRGEVKVNAVRADKIICTSISHNKATNNFFYLLVQAIAQNTSYLNLMPQYIVAYSGSEKVSIVSILKTSQNVYWENNIPKVDLMFTIPYNNLVVGKKVDTYKLYSDTTEDSGKLIATTTVSDSDKITTDGKTNLVVTWTMQFNNGGNA